MDDMNDMNDINDKGRAMSVETTNPDDNDPSSSRLRIQLVGVSMRQCAWVVIIG